jgi:hypothetical protein
MRSSIVLLLAACLLSFSIKTSHAQDWQELKGEHFMVYFTDGVQFAKEVLEKSETYYRRIASDLGYPRYSNFWTWDNRVKIYIYQDRADYLAVTHQAGWSEGMADYKKKEIISYAWKEGFVESLLPHEIAHLVFRDFVGFKGEVPLWLDEGVAQWTEEAKRSAYKAMSKTYLGKNTLLSLGDMMKLDIRNLNETERIHIRSIRRKNSDRVILFIGGEELVNAYYLQAVSIVGFLIEKYGAGSFTDFCRELRDGKTMHEALSRAYSASIRGIDELEEKWLDYLQEE